MSGPRVKRKSFETKVKTLEWQDCLVPKPALEAPILVDFLGQEWKIVAWDGEILQTLPVSQSMDLTVKELLRKYPNLQIPDHILDHLIDSD